MTIAEAQQDSRRAFIGGGPGAVISGMLWLFGAVVLRSRGVGPGFAVMFFGGMFIFPLMLLVSRFVFQRSPVSADNQLSRVAIESTIAMIGGLVTAWLFLNNKPAYVIPVAAIAVGTHYAAFRTVYGDILYWLLGGLIAGVGVIEILRPGQLPGGPALSVALVEILFGIFLTVRNKRA